MKRLSVNIDHIANIRQARQVAYPGVAMAVSICELVGVDGITCHLREDRRHIQDEDVRLIKQVTQLPLNLEMAATDEMISFAGEVLPAIVTLVPEKREELTTEGGLELDVVPLVVEQIKKLRDFGLEVSVFVEPEQKNVELACRSGAQIVELHTGLYAEAKNLELRLMELERIVSVATIARREGLKVFAGHGLHVSNIQHVADVAEIEEFSIGHGIVARAVFVGLVAAIEEIKMKLCSCK